MFMLNALVICVMFLSMFFSLMMLSVFFLSL